MSTLAADTPTAPAAPAAPLTQEAIEAALAGGPAAVRFVPGWAYEKLLAAERRAGSPAAAGSRVRAHAIPAARLAALARDLDIPLPGVDLVAPPPADAAAGESLVILLARPDPDVLAATPPATTLARLWRLIFHARVRASTLAAIHADGPDAAAAAQRRVRLLGRPTFAEARFVLLRDRFLSHTADDAAAWAEFAAVYLDLTYFNPRALTAFFPSVGDHDACRAVLDRDVASGALLDATRPPGAGDPSSLYPDPDDTPPPPHTAAHLNRLARKDAGRVDSLVAGARHADTVGNDVRAAIYRMRACRTGPPEAASIYADARADLDDLVRRLTPALDLTDEAARGWRAALGELLDNAAGGWWNTEGRLLYDLQKVCVYHEREIYSVNVVDYCLERGRRPLKRAQPNQRLVLTIKALRSALARTDRARVSARARAALRELIEAAEHAVIARLLAALRPQVAAALAEGGLEPRSTVERLAREKMTDELLDTLVARGYLKFSDVRDAVSRNQIKLDDLSGRDFVKGDALLRIDRCLEDRLDYVYHRGEIYLRAFHRLSATFFATPVGRLITKLAILPVGGAYLILEGLDHTVGKLLLKARGGKTEAVAGIAHTAVESLAPTPTATAAKVAAEHTAIFTHWWSIVLLAVILLGAINVPPVRRVLGRGLKWLGRALHAVFIAAPRWVATRPLVVAAFHSRALRFVARYTLKPLLFAAVIWLFVPDYTPLYHQLTVIALAFVGINLVLNTPAGRLLEQEVLHVLRTTVARYGWEILLALGRAIMHLFAYLLEMLDRFLYAVDEMLRFRAGQSSFTVGLKAALGAVWFFVAYLTRFITNLLVEPQINPIKHFPVVTVSHKLLLPTIPLLRDALISVGIESGRALATAGAIVTSIPGIFGFLAWEFRENWKLYRANRPTNLKPVKVGSHGETIGQFLRPGFHSGTLPKAFARLRKLAARKDAPPAATAKPVHAIGHVEHALHAFVDRDLLALLNQHPLFAGGPLHLTQLRPSTTQIRVTLERGGPGTSPGTDANGHDSPHHAPSSQPATPGAQLTLLLEQRSGWILASVAADTLTPSLTPDQRTLLSSALLGFYKMSAVDLVREHALHLLALPAGDLDLRKKSLRVWPAPDTAAEVAYPLTGDGPWRPIPPADLPTLRPDTLLLSHMHVPRAAWNALWDAAPESPVAPLPAVHLFPARA